MGSQFEVEPDQKFRLQEEEIAMEGQDADGQYEEEREKMMSGMMEQNPTDFRFENRDSLH